MATPPVTQLTPQPSVDIRREYRYRQPDAGTFHLLVAITAPDVRDPERTRPPLDLSFIVDRSGSMGGGAFELARQGVEHALALLDERDTVSLVVYDDRIDTLLSQRHLDHTSYAKAIRRLARIQPRGSTDLAGGWLTGCDQLAPLADASAQAATDVARPMRRALLLSDGLANVGITDAGEIATHAAELSKRGITTSTFGVGDHYDEDLLAGMADSGGGHFHHIADATAIPRVFAGELGEMLAVAMRSTTLALRIPEAWTARLVNDLPFDRSGDWVNVTLGELASGESRRLLWELSLPISTPGDRETIDMRLSWMDAEGVRASELPLSHTIETHTDRGAPDERVQNELARLYGARARAEAIRYNKAGDFASARQAMLHYQAAMPATAVGMAEARELERDADMLSAPASSALLKRRFADSRGTQRGRRDYSQEPPR